MVIRKMYVPEKEGCNMRLNVTVYCGDFLQSNYLCLLAVVTNNCSHKSLNHVAFLLLGDTSVTEFYIPTFRNTLFHLHMRCKQEE